MPEAEEAFNSAQLARRIAELMDEKKAEDVVILDVGNVASYTDYFVIATGGNERQIRAIHDAVYEGLKHDGNKRLLPARTEGLGQAQWVLLDYLDVVIHIFSPEARGYYRLDKLWGDVPELE